MARRARVGRRVTESGRARRRRALRLPRTVPEALSPLSAIVPGQLLALRLAEARGYDADKPRGPQQDHADALADHLGQTGEPVDAGDRGGTRCRRSPFRCL